jgi:tetratricopeptide (TPR) repeat protein
MQLGGKSIALYGRFSPGARERLAAEVERRGGRVARDFMRGSTLLVVGALAAPLVADGRLAARLAAARTRGAPVFAERRFAEALARASQEPAASMPLDTVVAQAGLSRAEVDMLAAFDIVRIDAECCRFGDAGATRATAELLAAGRTLLDAVRILATARDLAPKGRRKIVAGPRGQGALEWESGLTTLEGQGYLPLDESAAASVDDLFEAAAAAEAEGEALEAARLYDMSARADRKDPIAPFNLGNIKLAAEDFAAAVMAYRQALARDPAFVEARYNLAQSLERLGKLEVAREELARALEIEPSFADARFNLAQLELKRGEIAAAKAQFETYLAADPPEEWAAKARKAILYCAARLSA